MRTSAFICYSRDDQGFQKELLTHLQPYSDAIDVWSDQAIPPGVTWLPEIDRALMRADAAVIIVSPSLLASKFVTTHEIPRILDRHERDGMRPMLIHFRPSSYERTALARFQWLHDFRKPLSSMRKPARDAALVNIVQKICVPPPQRPIANILRSADSFYAEEKGENPSVTAKVGPDRIEMKERGQTRPFVTKVELEARLSDNDRRVLHTHETAMDSLMRRWSTLHPSVTAGGADADERDVVELSQVRAALANEFDAALGYIETLGYRLDDHYHHVRHALSPLAQATRSGAATPPTKPTIAARFVEDKQGRPQWSNEENGYWLQAWMERAPARTASVVWRMHRSVTPSQETVESGPEFRKEFISHGNFTLRADLRTSRGTIIASIRQDLAEALRKQYPGNRLGKVRKALADIEDY